MSFKKCDLVRTAWRECQPGQFSHLMSLNTSRTGVRAAALSPVKADSHPFSPLWLMQVFIAEEGSCLGRCRCTWLMAESRGKGDGAEGSTECVPA